MNYCVYFSNFTQQQLPECYDHLAVNLPACFSGFWYALLATAFRDHYLSEFKSITVVPKGTQIILQCTQLSYSIVSLTIKQCTQLHNMQNDSTTIDDYSEVLFSVGGYSFEIKGHV